MTTTRAGTPAAEGRITRTEALAGLAAALALGLLVRLWATGWESTARPEDAAYYVGVARNLVNGRGLVIDAIWTYMTPPLTFPKPAFEIWLPLPTFLAAIPMALLGAATPATAFASAQVASIVMGLVVIALAMRVGADVAEELALPRERALTLTIGSALGAAVLLPLTLHSVEPDSTLPFGALTLGATLLMVRLVRAGTAATARRLVVLGVLLGLAALARNEAIWVALVWAGLAVRTPGTRAGRLRLVAVPAVVAVLVYAPWAVRDLLVFGTPFPGQAAANALSVKGTDIFAWQDPPTLARYLAQGPAALVGQRLAAVWHDLWNDLLVLGLPASIVGLIGLPGAWRVRALRPLVLVALVIFTMTALMFPVATTWGTFLHSAGAIHVLLVVSALLLADRVAAAVSRRRGWTRPVAWTGTVLVAGGALAFTLLLLPTTAPAIKLARAYAILPAALDAADRGAAEAPIITDTPIFLATKSELRGLALPDESPASVLDLARRYGARVLVVAGENGTNWLPRLTAPDAGPAAACFVRLPLGGTGEPGDPGSPISADPVPLHGVVAFRILEACP